MEVAAGRQPALGEPGLRGLGVEGGAAAGHLARAGVCGPRRHGLVPAGGGPRRGGAARRPPRPSRPPRRPSHSWRLPGVRRRPAPRLFPRVVAGAPLSLSQGLPRPPAGGGGERRARAGVAGAAAGVVVGSGAGCRGGGDDPGARRRGGPARPDRGRVGPLLEEGPPLSHPRRAVRGRGRLPPPALRRAPAGDRASLVRSPGLLLRGQHLRQLLLDLSGHQPARPGVSDQRSHRPRRRGDGHPIPLDLLRPAHLLAATGLSALSRGAGPVRRPVAGPPHGDRQPEPPFALARCRSW